MTLLVAKTKIFGFAAKLDLYTSELVASRYNNFPNLTKCVPISQGATCAMSEHLVNL